jgi:hypothetical protein
VLTAFVCATCGVQYPPSPAPPDRCIICEDDRQYVGWSGQRWTTIDELARDHTNSFAEEEPGLHSILTRPSFGINQRAFLLAAPQGNVLWDCISLLDPPTLERVRNMGGLSAIAISHPHYYSTMYEWSAAFGNIPIYIHEADRNWVTRPESNVVLWNGEHLDIPGGLTLVRCGGHFEGFQVMVWPGGADGRGVLLAGDQPQVAMDRKSVSFLYSYPNMIPLGPRAVRRIVDSLAPWQYDRLYGAFEGRLLRTGAKDIVRWSAERYLRFISDS